MPHKNRSWFARFFGRPEQPKKRAGVKLRRLTLEPLEHRTMLTATLAQYVALITPNPHPAGDQPAAGAQVITLAAYTPVPLAADDGTGTRTDQYTEAVEPVYAAIAANPAARPAVWVENVAGNPNQICLHFDDNGMLPNYYSVTWGDGSAAQPVPGTVFPNASPNPSPTPWVVHQYPASGEYAISITAYTLDGTYSATAINLFAADMVGIGGGSSGLQATLPDRPPTLQVAGPQKVAAGAPFALDNLVSLAYANESGANSFTYSMDWGDCSQPFTGSNVVVINSGSNASPFLGVLSSSAADGALTHVYSNPGTYNLAVTITATDTGLSDTQIIPVTVAALTSTISVSSSPVTDDTCNEGDTVEFDGSMNGNTSGDPVAYAWQITDSSGDHVAQSTDPSLTFTFSSPDTYTVTLMTSVDGITTTPAMATITVNPLAPVFASSAFTATANEGEAFALPAVTFTQAGLDDTHTATVTWDNGNPSTTTDDATVTEESADSVTLTPGTIADSYSYATAGSYTGTIKLTESDGEFVTQSFSVTVGAAAITLTNFSPASGNAALSVSYMASADSGPFTIGIYTSPDGTTPDQLLTSYPVGAVDPSELTAGTHTISTPTDFSDPQQEYHLIAVADNGGTDGSTLEFSGGIFAATDPTQTPPQNYVCVFGTPYEGTGTPPSETVTVSYETVSGVTGNYIQFGGSDYLVDPSVAAVDIRTEGGDDTVTGTPTIATAAIVPLIIYGGSGDNTFTGGAASNLIVPGSGQNTIQSSNGVTSPQTVDDSDVATGGLRNNFQEAGTWTSETVAGAFNGEELLRTSSGSTDYAAWTFANLDPTAYYDVYVTWTPIAGVLAGGQYSVWDGGTQSDGGAQIEPLGQTGIAYTDQTQPPVDYQTAGEYWHDLGVFRVNTTTLAVQLGASLALADAAMIVPYTTPPLTNLTMNSFAVDSSGNLNVTYTVNGQDSPPFSIGIYQSAGGVQPGALAGTIDVSDPTDLSGGGTTHTVTYGNSLNGLDGGQYYIAQLDCNAQVEEVTRADNTSTALTGQYQDSSGDLYVLTASSPQVLAITEDPSGDVSVAGQTFSSVGSVYVSLEGGGNAVNIDSSVSSPLVIYGSAGGDTIADSGSGDAVIHGGLAANTITCGAGTTTVYCGAGGDTVTGGTGNAEIYGGAGADVLYGGQGNNWIQAGSGNATIYGGPNNDWLLAGTGNDTISGGAGTEKIFGGSGTDHLYGGPGLDDITGGSGTNFIYGNGIHDLLIGGSDENFIQPNKAYPPYALASIDVESSVGAPTFDGNIDQSGNSFKGDYREIDGPPAAIPTGDPSYGGYVDPGEYGNAPEAQWNFTTVDSGVRLGEDSSTPTAVYVTWRSDVTPTSPYHWSHDAAYEVLDDGTPLANNAGKYLTIVDQTMSPNDNSPIGADRLWTLLGVWNVPASDTLTVDLFNLDSSADVALCAGDAMIHAIWPTVSIRPTDVTVNPNVPGPRDGDYIDWFDACQPVNVPIEGQGNRVQFQLKASIESLYADIPGASISDWQAEMNINPENTGLELWSSSIGGSALTDTGFSALIPSGNFSGSVWVSADNGQDPVLSLIYVCPAILAQAAANANIVVKRGGVTMTLIQTGDPVSVDKTDFNIADNIPNGPFGPAASNSMGWNQAYTGVLINLAQSPSVSNIVQATGRQPNGQPILAPLLGLNPPTPHPLKDYFTYQTYVYEYDDKFTKVKGYILANAFAVTFTYKAPAFSTYNIALDEQQEFTNGNPALTAIPDPNDPNQRAQFLMLLQRLQALKPVAPPPLAPQAPQPVPPANAPQINSPRVAQNVNGMSEIVFTDMPSIQGTIGIGRRQLNLQTYTITSVGLFGKPTTVAQFKLLFDLEMSATGVPAFRILWVQ
jgi:hypothetical protein